MCETGDILESMTTSIVVTVPKKGDIKDPDNYIRIYLIRTLVKLLAEIVASKLAKIDRKYKLYQKSRPDSEILKSALLKQPHYIKFSSSGSSKISKLGSAI
ncbi:hypothetical protein AYI68_g7691 [Smittium mucronatum]|uniref:Uncharacterized protein n=1 Tax=Smittium mucronatum TaxID=133383 RepID=A0A1R0GMY8_9FUNG|nr:hypothetical protein AYI68_g7691 [Smittium mucronatum]